MREGQSVNGFFAKQYANFFDMHSEQSAFYLGPGIGYGPMFMEWATDYLQGGNPKGEGSRRAVVRLVIHWPLLTNHHIIRQAI